MKRRKIHFGYIPHSTLFRTLPDENMMQRGIFVSILTFWNVFPAKSFSLPSDPVSSSLSSSQPISTLKEQRKVNLITFDLDDTLFPIGPVVQDANDAMFQTLADLGYPEACLEGYTAACKAIRKSNYQPGVSNPITYSELRRRAIQIEMENCRKSWNDDGKAKDLLEDHIVVEKSFNAWLEERHASAERNLFPDAIDMLKSLKEEYPDVCIGAVTNGRGNPLYMHKTIKPYFDFCVSGEDEGVFPNRKPHPGIFEATLSKAASLVVDDDRDEYCWIHVGDDLANDVGASAACGAKAVLMSLEDEEKEKEPKLSFVSTASKEEQEAREKLNKEAYSSVSAKITSLSDLAEAIRSIVG